MVGLVGEVIIAYTVHFIYLRIRAVRVCVFVGLSERNKEKTKEQKKVSFDPFS